MAKQLSKEELTDIDLDIISLMAKIPNDSNNNSIYIRWNKNYDSTFFKILCEPEDLHNLLGVLLYKDENCIGKKDDIIEAAKFAILNLAIHILSEKTKDEINDFNSFILNEQLINKNK